LPGVEDGGLEEFLQRRSGEILEQGAADHLRRKQPGLLLLAAALTMLAYAADVGKMTLNPPLQVPARAQQAVTLAPDTAAAMLPSRFDSAIEQLSFSGTVMQTASEGAAVYSERCAVCHGPGGEGGIGPSLVEGPLSVEVLVEVVTNGRNAMPSFGASLGADEIEAVALHIESLGSSPATTTATASTAAPIPAAADLFADHCARCHGPSGAGGGPLAPPLHLKDQQFDDVVAVVSKGRGLMPSFSETLEEAEIEDVALYAVSLEAENAPPATLSPTARTPEGPEEQEPTGSRADLTPVIVYLCIVALVAFGLLIDYFRNRARYHG
jgi:mono/diheme cytochrome c family protein